MKTCNFMSCPVFPLDSFFPGLMIQGKTIVKARGFAMPLYLKNAKTVFSIILCLSLTFYSLSQNFFLMLSHSTKTTSWVLNGISEYLLSLVIVSQHQRFLG